MGQRFSFSRLCLITLANVVFVTASFAAVPANYKGKPWKGTPRAVPGKVFFAEFDVGGGAQSSINGNVWYADNTDKGPAACGGVNSYRADDGDNMHPVVYQTNVGNVDKYEDGSVFPSAENPEGYYYVGCSHPNDWYSVTINVKYKGTYWLSSTWATEAPQTINFHLEFNDVKTPIDINGTKTEVVDLGHTPLPEWHTWKKFEKFGKVTLDTGVQVLKWVNHKSHLNNSYLQFDIDNVEILPSLKTSSPNALAQVLAISSAANTNLKNVQYSVREPGQTSMAVYDCAGRAIMQVFNQNVSAGKHVQTLNLTGVTNGVYFLHLTSNNQSSVTRFQYTR
jgi:hypothetical protein